MKILKKSVIKIALAFLLALLTISLCVFGSGYNKGDAVAETDNVSVNVTLKPLYLQHTIYSGESYTIKITISTAVVGSWNSLSLNIVPLQADGVSVDSDKSAYFKMGEITFNLPFNESNLVLLNDDEFAQGAGAKISFFYSGEPVATSTDLVISLNITVKDMPEDINNVNFGVAPLKSNFVAVKTDSGVFKYQADQKVYIGTELNNSFTGDCITFNTLKYNVCHTQAMIHISSDKTEFAAGEAVAITVEVSVKRTDIKWNHIDFPIAPLTEEHKKSELSEYFEFISGRGRPSIGAIQNSTGIRIISTKSISTRYQFTVDVVLKVEENAPAVQFFDFGIVEIFKNNMSIVDSQNNLIWLSSTDSEQITTNTIPMSIKAA